VKRQRPPAKSGLARLLDWLRDPLADHPSPSAEPARRLATRLLQPGSLALASLAPSLTATGRACSAAAREAAHRAPHRLSKRPPP